MGATALGKAVSWARKSEQGVSVAKSLEKASTDEHHWGTAATLSLDSGAGLSMLNSSLALADTLLSWGVSFIAGSYHCHC